MSRKIEYIDFAKGYAIFTIVIYHALQRVPLDPLWQKAIIFGGTGVHLFFLLSGFGLALSKTPLSPIAFYRRRLTKVWLPYTLALTISLLAAISFDLFPDRLAAWLAGVLLYQMFFESWIQSFGGHFWFISAIMQFYLVFPLLIWAKNHWGDRRFLLTCLALSVLWWLIVYYTGKGDQRTWNSFLLQFLWEFGLGMLLASRLPATAQSPAWLQNTRWNNPGILLLVGVGFTGIMILMIFKMGDAGKIFNDVPALLGYTALSLFVYQISTRFLPFLKRFFCWVGGFSFSLYLVHVLVLDGYLRVLEMHQVAINLPVLVPFVGLALLAGVGFEWVSSRITNG